jgi:tRNA A-37 threonylcarbamoyl transferase component Bud32
VHVSAAAPGVPPAVPGAEEALVGTVLAGRYRILRKLGEGAMGAVYLGEHLRIGRHDAIKVLRESLAADREAMARFVRGARHVSSIHHPNVCTVYDFSEMEDGRCFLAMEFVSGETLQDLLAREGRLTPARAVRLAGQVAGALQAAHDAGIVHRDLKPGNVMVSAGRGGEDVVKVVDFDIAKGSAEGQGGDVTRLGFVIGTPEYMSPEQLLGMALDGRSDVYSLALVLFRMLAGALPFRAQDTQELMVQRLTGTPLRLDEVLPALQVSPALQAALDRALQRRAEDRFAGAAEFADAIARAVAEAPVPAAPAPVDAAPPPRLGETRGGVPHTLVTPERGPSGAAAGEDGDRPRTPHPFPLRRAGLAAAAVVIVTGGAWGVSRVLGPPGAGAVEERAAQDEDGAAAGLRASPSGPASVPLMDSTAAGSAAEQAPTNAPGTVATLWQPDAAPAEPVRREPAGPSTAGTREREKAGPPGPPPVRDDPPDEVPPARREGMTAATAPAVAGRLSGYLSDAGLSRGALRAVSDSARQVLALGGGVPARDRANAAYVLGVVAYRQQDWGECIRRLEQAEQLNPTSTRRTRVMLDACRERQA